MIELTTIPFCNKKYEQFYNKYKFIPKMFNPYNCAEVTDFAPTLTTQCGGVQVLQQYL